VSQRNPVPYGGGSGARARTRHSLRDRALRLACVVTLLAGYVPMTVLPAYAAGDTTPPAAITDLDAVPVGATLVDLNWTAPGDNGNSGTATAYDIRYSTSPIYDDASFSRATHVNGAPDPQVAGSDDDMTINELQTGVVYYFAIKTRDSDYNWSELSNVPSAEPRAGAVRWMSIDSGSAQTATTTVTVTSSVAGAQEMRVRNSTGEWSGWFAYTASMGFTLSSGDGLKTVQAEYSDGTVTYFLSDTITLDTTAPEGTMTLDANASHTTTRAVTVTSAVTGATAMRMRNAGEATWSNWTAYGATAAHRLSPIDGTKSVEAEYRDAAGNVLALSDAITLDTAAPEGTMTLDSDASVTGTRSVTVGSDVVEAADMRVRNAAGTWSAWTPYVATAPHQLSAGDGAKTVEAQYRDVAGNVRTLTDTITLDTLAPVGTMQIDGGAAYTAVTGVTVDSAVTGATQMRVRAAGGSWSPWTPYAVSKPLTLSSGDGLKTGEAEYRDAAGNVLALSDTIELDANAPTGTMSIEDGAVYTATTAVTIRSAVTSAVEMRLRGGAGVWAEWVAYADGATFELSAGDGLKTVQAEYRNDRGTVLARSDSIVLDTTPPTVGHAARSLYTDGSAEISLIGADALSWGGLVWSIDGGADTTDAEQFVPIVITELGQHTLTYHAFDLAGNSSAPVTVLFTVAATGPQQASIALGTASMTLPAYGAAVSITGTLTVDGEALDGMPVTLQSSADGVTFADTAMVATTTATGAFSLPATPTVRTYYRVRFATNDSYIGTDSAAVSILPRVVVSNPIAPSKMSRTRSKTVYGNLWPKHTAGSTTTVRIYKYRYVRGKWKPYGYVKAKLYDRTGYSRYSASVRLKYAGKWRLRAYAPADGGHAAQWSSGYDKVTVR